MNRDDLLLMAFEANLFNSVEGCPNCAIRIPNMEGLERFAFIFFQAARQEMIKQGWRHCAEGQQTTQYCPMAEAAIRARNGSENDTE